MRYIFLGLTIIFVGLLMFEGYNYYLNLTKTKIEVEGLKSKYFPGSDMNFNVDIVNLSRTDKCFFVDLRIKFKTKFFNFPRTFFILHKGDKITNKYVHSLPKNLTAGNYQIELELKNKTVNSERTLAKRVLSFRVNRRPVKPKPLDGNIKFIALPEEINFGDKLVITTIIENVINRKGKFRINVSLQTPSIEEGVVYKPEILTRIMNINKKSKKLVKFEYQLSEDKPDGEYILTARLFEKGTAKLLSTDETAISIVDQPPEIVFEDIGLSVKKGEQPVYKVRVTDDRGIKSVRYYQRDLKTDRTTSYMMTLISGDNSEGIWSCSVGVDKKTRKFKFYVAAVDTKNQEIRTDEYSIAVLR